MTENYTKDYLLNKEIIIFQPTDGYRASSDAVLVSSLIDRTKAGETILDVGSGTGAISLCLASRLQKYAPRIVGIECQSQLAELANMSAAANGFGDFLHYENADIKTQKILQNCSFHHVISNPPYADKDMPSPNQSKALAHNHHDCSLAEWIAFCLKMLRPFGFLYLIHRAEALSEIISGLQGKAGNITVFPIYSKDRQNAKRVMIIAQKDSKTPLKIYPPFQVHKSDGGYSTAAEKILREGSDFFTATQKPLS